MKIATKVVYLVVFVALTMVPLSVWAVLELDGDTETHAQMDGIGAYIAGLGVVMAPVTIMMGAKRISENNKRTTE